MSYELALDKVDKVRLDRFIKYDNTVHDNL